MSGEIQPTNAATQTAKAEPSTAKRIAYTLCTVPSSVFTFTKNLAEGKNIYEAGNAVRSDIRDVHDANISELKENVKRNSEAVDNSPVLYSLYGRAIKLLNSVLN